MDVKAKTACEGERVHRVRSVEDEEGARTLTPSSAVGSCSQSSSARVRSKSAQTFLRQARRTDVPSGSQAALPE